MLRNPWENDKDVSPRLLVQKYRTERNDEWRGYLYWGEDISSCLGSAVFSVLNFFLFTWIEIRYNV